MNKTLSMNKMSKKIITVILGMMPCLLGSAQNAVTARDVVYPKNLTPKRTWNYFHKAENGYPRAKSIDASLFLYKSADDSLCIAKGGEGIVYGETVSRNEFGIEGGIFFSPDSTKVAFYRKDESNVADYPYMDITTQALKTIKYPMNSKTSEIISLGIYDIASSTTTYIKADDFTQERYISCVTWSDDSKLIYAQILDRNQQNLRLNCYDTDSGECVKTLLQEHSDTWVEPQYPLRWIKGQPCKCIYTTDNRDSWTNLYLLDCNSLQLERLAPVENDMQYLANDGKWVYYTAADEHPVNNYLWRVNLKSRKVEQLTREEGWHSIEMAPDCSSFVDVYENVNQAPESRLVSVKTLKVLELLQPQDDPSKQFALPQIETGSIASADGNFRNYWRFVKPVGFDPTKKYPVILYVYGGPHSQMVQNRYMAACRKWELYAASKGFAVFVMDGRGTINHGTAYEHSIFGQCGVNEAADQMKAVNEVIINTPWVDKNRIGVYGWSYGGFMSLTLATGNPDIFKVCVAGGPVIDWKWYEIMYGERYMGRISENPERFCATSLLPKAKNLKSKTLLIQGTLDPTVVPLNARSFLQECIDNGIQIDYFEYPKAGHNMRGEDRVHLVNKITDYFIANL